MVYGFEQFSAYFFKNFPGYTLSPLRLSISRLESLFGTLKFQAHGSLSAGNYGSSLGRVKLRQELKLTARATSHDQKGYRDQVALVSGPHSMSTLNKDQQQPYIEVMAHYVPYGYQGVKEFIFPSYISQSTFQGRQGSSACTLIALIMGFKFSSGLIGEPQKVLDVMWFNHVVSSISEGNKIFDECFSSAGVGGLDVEDVFSSVGDDLHLLSYEDPKDFFVNGNDFQHVITYVKERVNLKRKSVGIFVSGGRSVAILIWENGACAVFDSHRHLQYGCILSHSLSSKDNELVLWLAKTSQKFYGSSIQFAQITWVEYDNC